MKEIIMINVIERVNTWVMEDEPAVTLEAKDLLPEEDAILSDITWLFREHVDEGMQIEEGGGDASVVVVPALSDKEQLQNGKDIIPSVGMEKYKDEGALDIMWLFAEDDAVESTIEEAVTEQRVPRKKSRSRTRRFFIAVWKGAKRLLLCGL